MTPTREVFRLDRDFRRESRLPVEWFGRASGLPSSAGRGWGKGLMKSRDGRIWLATAKGAAVIDSRDWAVERDQTGVPLVHIEEVWLDEHLLDLRRGEGIVVPPGARRLDIHGSHALLKFAFERPAKV